MQLRDVFPNGVDMGSGDVAPQVNLSGVSARVYSCSGFADNAPSRVSMQSRCFVQLGSFNLGLLCDSAATSLLIFHEAGLQRDPGALWKFFSGW